MQKIRTLLKAPVLTQSGYGVHSRQIFDALLSDPLFDLHVESINWGNCSFLTENTTQKQQINQCIDKAQLAKQQNQENYDLFVHITVPNEYERKGRVNVGVTAGIETDRVSHVWIQKCNEMDLNIVPSEHSKKVFLDTVVDWENPQTKERGSFKLEKPMVVCAEGVDTSIFKPLADEPYDNKIDMTLDSEFNFLHIGQWGNGNFGEDRKNIALMLKYFIETFRGRKDVGLVLKTNMSRNSEADYGAIKARLENLKQAVGVPQNECPPIYLVHANLSNEEMSSLYKHPKIKAFLTLTHGEGFGIPVLEAAACGLPVLATNWSGHLDILKDGKFIPLDYDLTEIPESVVWDPILIKGSKWATANEEDVKKKMDKITKSLSKPKEWADQLVPKIVEKFDIKATNDFFVQTIKQSLLGNVMQDVNPVEQLASLVDTEDSFNVIYTMPMSTGDVFISTAVIDGLMKQLPEDAKVYFATNPKYFDLLKGNKNIYKCIPWNQQMASIDLLEEVFDLALTPNMATQYTFSNWVRRGQGRLLAEEFANYCQSELGEYFIEKDESNIVELLFGIKHETEGEKLVPGPFVTFHPGSGKGQWEGREYREWPEVLENLKDAFPDLKVVQVGGADEPLAAQTDVDLRGKTTYQQLAAVTERAALHLGIDSFNMHLAAALKTPLVAIFGCSYATATGPWVKEKENAKFILLQSERQSGCKNKACYKNKCKDNPHDGAAPINEIDPRDVFQSCAKVLLSKEKEQSQ
jgi:ADP-heptose:LPS heptosyltransferase/glycosyltransferase involved in cell wall biosynthesis